MYSICYPYFVTANNKNLILAWYSNNEGDDIFHTIGNSLLLAYDKLELEAYLKNINFDIVWDQTNSEIDLDNFPAVLQLIKYNEYIDVNICTKINDTWNFFDDLDRTFSNENKKFERKNEALDKIYHKFFYGMNLQAVTPKNEIYHPIFSKEEVTLLNLLMINFTDYAKTKLIS